MADLGKMTVGVLTVVVAVVVIAMFAIPSIQDATMEKTYNAQDGAADYDSGAFAYSYASSTLTVDGASFTPPDGLLAFGESFKISNSSGYKLAHGNPVTVVDLGDTWTATMDAHGSLTVVSGSNEVQIDAKPSETFHQVAADGEFVLIKEGAAKINLSSGVYSMTGNASSIAYLDMQKKTSGSYDGLYYNASGSAEATWTWLLTDQGDGSFNLSSLTFNTYDAVFIVPSEYYTLSEGSGPTSALWSIVPLLLIISAVMIAVRLLAGRD